MKITDKFVFFWKSYLGNWSKAPKGLRTVINGRDIIVPTSEHLFMLFKAEYFKDYENFENILNTDDPKEAKDYGRQVKNFNQEAWDNVCFDMMYKALKIRFEQDQKFANKLMSEEYSGKEFVEASPYDRIWGIGMAESNPYIEDKTKWRGKNYLGQCLNKLVEYIKSKE